MQSLKFQAASRNYSELGSCPSLNSGRRPLLARSFGGSAASNEAGGAEGSIHEEFVQTAKGRILVARQGNSRKPAIITYHDLGLNYSTNFQVGFRVIFYFRVPFTCLLGKYYSLYITFIALILNFPNCIISTRVHCTNELPGVH